MDIVEFPITLPNQGKVERVLMVSSYSSIIFSLIAGIVTGDIKYAAFVFGIQFIITLLLVLPNWPQYKKERSIQWLQVKI
jgi:hypothetical protein